MELVCILSLFIIFCHAIGEDYFLESDNRNSNDRNDNISLSRPKQGEVHKNQTLESTCNIKYSTDSILINNVNNVNDKKNITDSVIDENFINTVVGKRISDTDYINNDILYETSQARKLNVQNFHNDNFSNYNKLTSLGKILRSLDLEAESDTINFSGQIKETTEKLVIDFFNLHPVEIHINKEDEMQDNSYMNKYTNDVWYVPENLPCWDLPILYGELGEMNNKKDVFLTIVGKLKQVIEKSAGDRLATKKLTTPDSQTHNKWCSNHPCYGDHTLCLFSEPVNSKLCVNDYEVSTPTTNERIALVNTVNSMRNRVATRTTDLYKHLPTAADMKQITYDFDLQSMAEAWLHQCLPGPSACSSLDSNYVAHLECTKYIEHCCFKSYKDEITSKCVPQTECYIEPMIGCIHIWFRSAAKELTATDVECGRITPTTFDTVQLLWAETNKIGCAYGKSSSGDVRVVCNFAPGAPFLIHTQLFCGFIGGNNINRRGSFIGNITSPELLSNLGNFITPVKTFNDTDTEFTNHSFNYSIRLSDVDILSKIYHQKWMRQQLNTYDNSTLSFVARLVTKYTFEYQNGLQCDMNRNIYKSGDPGSLCVEGGRRFHALCYDYRDPTPFYRLIAILAPIALFSLILYDLFSGVLRQSNY